MKYFINILLFLFIFCFHLQAENEKKVRSALYENKEITPVQPDEKLLEKFQKDKAYDYYQYTPEGEGFLSWLLSKFHDWWVRNIDVNVTEKQVNVTFWIITGAVIVILLLLLFIFKPSVFYTNKKKKMKYEVGEEDIEGMNFERLIRDAFNSGDYSAAIRWKYLFTLKEMQERELISYNVNKTVNEYVRELRQSDIKEDFKLLSQLFLYIRYGNFEASHEHFDEAVLLSDQIIKRL